MRLLPSLIVTVLAASSLSAQDRVAWKFEAGKSFFLQEVIKQDQVITVAGMEEQKRATTQNTLTRFDVLNVKPDGSVDLRMTFIQMKNEGDGAAQGAEVLKRMEGSEFSVSLDGKKKITKFDGYEKFVERISEGNEQLAKIFRSVLSEDSFKQLVRQTFTLAAGRDVSEGESWNQNLVMSLGPFGSVNVTRTLKHAGRGRPEGVQEGQFCKLEVTGKATYAPPTEDFPGVAFKIIEGDLQMDGMKGDCFFDLENGQLHSMRLGLNLNGSLTIAIGNQKVKVNLKQKQEATQAVTNNDPRLR